MSSHDCVWGPQPLKHLLPRPLQIKSADNRTSIRSSRQRRSVEEASNIQKKQAGLTKFISKTFTVLLDEPSTVRCQEKVTETYYKSMYRKERYFFFWRTEDWTCFLCGMWRKSHICDVYVDMVLHRLASFSPNRYIHTHQKLALQSRRLPSLFFFQLLMPTSWFTISSWAMSQSLTNVSLFFWTRIYTLQG